MTTLLSLSDRNQRRLKAGAVLVMLAGAVLCFALAPMLMPDSYSLIDHSVSESAAQGVSGAWLARTGFLLLGFSVLLLAQIVGEAWGIAGRLFHRIYGISVIAAAAFSHMPWEDVPYDEFEDYLHSAAANGVGLGFTVGVLVVSFGRTTWRHRLFDWFAVLAAMGISVTMFNVSGGAGMVQRVMFGIGFVWYGIEAMRLVPAPHSVPTPDTVDPGATNMAVVR